MKSDLQIAREIVCWNQGELAQFSYIASILHRNLKEKFYGVNCCKEKVKFSLNNLIEYLNRNLRRVSEKNFKFLHYYFSKRSKIDPRVCIKASYKKQIIELFRDRQVDYDVEYAISTNTGFQSVIDAGKYYLCNNMPDEYIKGNYKNPRLKNNSEINYSPSILRNIASSQVSDDIDNEWIKCWRDNNTGNFNQFYKSTLIIPMTLANNELSEQYKALINIMRQDRTIFGFLCIDHVKKKFFNELSDIDIGYIIADLLSLFLITRLNYTESSLTFNKSVDYIK